MLSEDVALLAGQAVPYMAAAAAAYRGAVLAKVRDDAADETVGLGRQLLQRVFGVGEKGQELPEPVQNLISYPQDGDALAALRLAVRKTLTADPGLASDVQALLSSSGVTVTAVAERIGLDEKVEVFARRTVINVLPRAVGVKLLDRTKPGWHDDPDAASYIEHLIPAGTQLPWVETLTANTTVPDQPAVEIEIWEQAGTQESPRLEDNLQVITSTITGVPPLPNGAPIDISINVDVDGRISVTAVEPRTRKRLRVKTRVSALSQEDDKEENALHLKGGYSQRSDSGPLSLLRTARHLRYA